ncbi:MAG: aromatic ring-hydroxylating dioxygenase subunit alpha [Bacteriovoracaceae bacterium]|nr:aromatic ring-hydroxylating dioxygenase subunit alpha [Bacteriovoracaceae bacterium]
MLTPKEIKECPRDDHPRHENVSSQPLNRQKVFNEPHIITKGWYPFCKKTDIQKTQAKSFTLLSQRIVIFRTKDGTLSALDSFCPHMGADLGNGEVIGNKLRCFYHHWTFDQSGNLFEIPCQKYTKSQRPIKIRNYPVVEKYGFIWVFSDEVADHEVPHPPSFEGEVSSVHLKKVVLFAHHHVMMTNGIDLQHFQSVHNLDIKFDFNVIEKEPSVFTWVLSGEIPRTSLLLKIAHYILGGTFNYEVLFAGGSITSITYGINQKFRGRGFTLPPIHILWGASPLKEGVSAVDIFFITKNYPGLLGPFKKLAMHLFTFIVLAILKDDDIKAFPHMRYNVGNLTPEDASLAKFIQLTNQLETSLWTNNGQ